MATRKRSTRKKRRGLGDASEKAIGTRVTRVVNDFSAVSGTFDKVLDRGQCGRAVLVLAELYSYTGEAAAYVDTTKSDSLARTHRRMRTDLASRQQKLFDKCKL